MSDTGTSLAYSQGSSPIISLKIIIQAQQALLNVYSAIVDSPLNSTLAGTNYAASMTFVNWLVSDAGQQVLANYGMATYGKQLFAPFVPLVTGTAPNATLLSWIESYAYIAYNQTTSLPYISASGTECPAQFRNSPGNLYANSYDAVVNPNVNVSIGLTNYNIADGQQIFLPITSKSLSKTISE